MSHSCSKTDCELIETAQWAPTLRRRMRRWFAILCRIQVSHANQLIQAERHARYNDMVALERSLVVVTVLGSICTMYVDTALRTTARRRIPRRRTAVVVSLMLVLDPKRCS